MRTHQRFGTRHLRNYGVADRQVAPQSVKKLERALGDRQLSHLPGRVADRRATNESTLRAGVPAKLSDEAMRHQETHHA